MFESTDSPALAAAAATLPTAFLELLGAFGFGKLAKGRGGVPSKAKIRATLKEAAPDPEVLKNIASSVYKEIDNAGITLKPKVFDGMIAKVEKAAKASGLSKRTTPIASGLIDDLKDASGRSVRITEIDDLRKLAQGVATNIDAPTASVGRAVVNSIDDFLDGISPKALESGAIAAKDIAPKYNVARNLWGRVRKSEQIQDAIRAAELTPSGFENGLRIEIGKIIKSKNRRPDEQNYQLSIF